MTLWEVLSLAVHKRSEMKEVCVQNGRYFQMLVCKWLASDCSRAIAAGYTQASPEHFSQDSLCSRERLDATGRCSVWQTPLMSLSHATQYTLLVSYTAYQTLCLRTFSGHWSMLACLPEMSKNSFPRGQPQPLKDRSWLINISASSPLRGNSVCVGGSFIQSLSSPQ